MLTAVRPLPPSTLFPLQAKRGVRRHSWQRRRIPAPKTKAVATSSCEGKTFSGGSTTSNGQGTPSGYEPWRAKTWGAMESVEAFQVVATTLGMDAVDFQKIYGAHPAIYLKPRDVLQQNAQSLVEQLGSREAALAFVKEWPGALALGSWTDTATYLTTELGWTPDAAQQFLASSYWLTSRVRLDGPMVQRALRLCREELGLSPSLVLRKHVQNLHSNPQPQQIFLRPAFLACRKLQSRLRGSAAFLADNPSQWEARLRGWGVSRLGWAEFEKAFLKSWEWELLQRAEEDHTSQAAVAPEVKRALERAVQAAGGERRPSNAAPQAANSGGVAGAGAQTPSGKAASSSRASGTERTKLPPAQLFTVDLAGKHVCCDGTAPIARATLTKLLEGAGATVQNKVDYSTDYVFSKDPDSGSAKVQKARSWGVEVLSYDDLLAL